MYEDRVCVCYQRERVCIDLDRDRGLNLYFTCIAKKCLFIRWNDYFKINEKKFCPRSQMFCCITNNRAYNTIPRKNILLLKARWKIKAFNINFLPYFCSSQYFFIVILRYQNILFVISKTYRFIRYKLFNI